MNNLKTDLIRINQKLKLPIEGVVEDKNQIRIANIYYNITDKTIVYSHKVKRYDNWYKIAKYYNTNLKTLLLWNNANKKTNLKVGQLIKIKMKGPILSNDNNVKLRYVVDMGDTIRKISQGFEVSQKDLLAENGIRSSRSLKAGTNLTIYK